MGVTLPEFRRVPTAFLARVAPHARIRLRNIERFYAIILLSTFHHTPLFFLRRLLSPPSSISCTFLPLMEKKGKGSKANLLMLNRRDGVAARIKLRGRISTAERRRPYRRNDYFPRGLTSDFVAPDLKPAPVRIFMCPIDRL